MLHLFQTPRTIAVLPSSRFDMAGYFTRKSGIRLHLPCAVLRIARYEIPIFLRETKMSVRSHPAKDFSYQVGDIRPQKDGDCDRGSKNSPRSRSYFGDPAGLMHGAKAAVQCPASASLPSGAQE